jgi:xylose isomerase
VIEFARGCMRTYLILKEKARRWAADSEIKGLLKQINRPSKDLDSLSGSFSKSHAETLLGMTFDRAAMAARPLPYERLDQRTMEILLGVD